MVLWISAWTFMMLGTEWISPKIINRLLPISDTSTVWNRLAGSESALPAVFRMLQDLVVAAIS
jgi:hypothetical protein